MSLIKLANGITDISGKLGGIVFGRDKSGLHARALQSQRTPQPTQKQTEQRNWYTRLKAEEHAGGPPEPADEKPHDENTALIYLCRSLTFNYYGCPKNPEKKYFEPDVEHAGLMQDFLSDYPETWNKIPGMTYELALHILFRFYGQALKTKGTPYTTAVTWACARFGLSMARLLLATTVATWFTAAMLIPIYYTIYWTVSIYNSGTAIYTFPLHACIARLQGIYYIAALVARPSARCWDFMLGQPLSDMPMVLQLDAVRKNYPEYSMYFEEQVSQVFSNALVSQVTLWDRLQVQFRTAAYQIDEFTYRAAFPWSMVPWNGAPIGWTLEEEPFDWLDNVYHPF